MKINFKKILAGIMAASMTISAVNLSDFGSFAANDSTDEPKSWSGKTVNFDNWNGSDYNYDWLTEHQGTESDPYAISSAAQLASLSQLTTSSDNYTDNPLVSTVGGLKTDAAYRLKWQYGTPGTLDPAPGSDNDTFYAIAKNAATNDKNSWYIYTTPDLGIKFDYQTDSSSDTDELLEFQKPFFQYEENEYQYYTQNGDVNTAKEYFITKACLPLVINGEKVYVDILDAIREYYLTTNGSYKFFFEPNVFTEPNKIYTFEEYSDADRGSMSRCSYYDVYGCIQYIEYTAADAKLTVKIGSGSSAVSKFIGFPSDFGLANFPAVTAKSYADPTNRYKDISIDASNVGEYYLPNAKTVTMPESNPSGLNLETTKYYKYNKSNQYATIDGNVKFDIVKYSDVQTAYDTAINNKQTSYSIDFEALQPVDLTNDELKWIYFFHRKKKQTITIL